MRIASETILTLLLTSIWLCGFSIQPARANGTIYIRADGSIDPPDAPISTFDNATYTLTGDINDSVVVLRDNITVDGAGRRLQGAGTGKGIDLDWRSNITIENVEIRGFWHGVYLSNSSNHNSIVGNNITKNTNGVYLSNSSNHNSIVENNITDNSNAGIMISNFGVFFNTSYNSISGNNLTGNSYGIDISGWSYGHSNHNSIVGNDIAKNTWGIQISYSSDNTISGNNVTKNSDGIDLRDSSDHVISGNCIENNLYGIWLGYSSSNNTIVENKFVNDGLEVYDSYGNSLENNLVNGEPLVYVEGASNYTVEKAGQVVLIKCQNILVQNLDLSNVTVGIQLWGTNNTKLYNNNVTNNVKGIWLQESFNDSIGGNTVANTLLYGIGLGDSSNNNINGNNIAASSSSGIVLDSSSNNSINGNNIEKNYDGIELGDSFNNSINGNTIMNNHNTGIWLGSSSNNTFCHNNLINTVQVDDSTPEYDNFWDNSLEGNYWSGYNGTEFDVYGIGSTPYVIDVNNADRFPLKSPYLSGDVNHDAKVNIVDITIIAKAFASQIGNTNWDPHADLDGNGKINIVDITKAAKEFGKEWNSSESSIDRSMTL